MSSETLIRELSAELKEFLSAQNVMGQPVDLGEKVAIPIARFGFGLGAGAGQGKDGNGDGAGAGGGIEPVALIILHKDVKGPEGVQVMSLKKDSAIAQVISALGESLAPQVIDALKTVSSGQNRSTPAKKEEL
ncbi:MAG: spore germination protein GerW family protein [Methanoregula sp.]|nr:MAG: spore germination protein GerW family protein [Methanoregula sp.]